MLLERLDAGNARGSKRTGRSRRGALRLRPRQILRGASALVIAVGLAAAGCRSSEPEAKPPPVEQFEAVERVRPPKVRPNLTVARVRKCIESERVDIDSLAGRYFGPTDFATDQVRETRELDFSAPSDIDIVDADEFSRRVGSTGEPRDRRLKAVNLWLQWHLGIRPLGSDGSATPPGNNKELIDGYYEHDSGRIVVKQEGDLDTEYVILAHELAHAAVDQVFEIPDKKTLRLVDDQTLATTAMVEGDATLVELRFSTRFSGDAPLRRRYVKRLVEGKTLERERNVNLPHAVLERFTFPYRWGLAFVCSVFDKGGWRAVNRLYERPPTSSAEIMFPKRYLNKERAEKPPVLGKPGSGWKKFADGAIGAADLKVLFEAPADSEERSLSRPLGRAAAWNGGRFQLWGRTPDDSSSVLGISLVERGARPGLLCSSMLEWYRQAFAYAQEELIADRTTRFIDPTRTTIIACDGPDVRIAMAPERELAETILTP